jgi:hypothetical protein
VSTPFLSLYHLFTQSLPVLNSISNQVRLHTFHGADGWFQGDQAQLDKIWDNPKSVGKPFQLLAPSIQDNLADATIESNYTLLEKIALEASWDYITSQIYQQISPQVGVDPASILQDIHHSSKDEKGEVKVLSVEQYFNAIQRMTNFLPKSGTWPLDVGQHFFTHLLDDVRQQMTANKYSYDSTQSSKTPYDQITQLQEAYAAATVAESQIKKIKTIARTEISAQSFHAHAHLPIAERRSLFTRL